MKGLITKISQVIVFIVFFVSFVQAAEKPADYAYGLRLDATGAAALYEVTLPPAVYQGVARRDLGDVRVFNNSGAMGEVVPHAWRARRTQTATAGATVPLTLFPLRAASGTAIDGLRVSVRRNANGTLAVDVNSDVGAASPQTAVVGYLIDCTALERAVQSIQLDWNTADGFSGKMRVDASDDLASWRTLVAGAPLVSIEAAGQRLTQKQVDLPAQKAKYLRLSWVGEGNKALPPVLTSAQGELTNVLTEAPRSWAPFTASAGEKPGEYVFDLQGLLPVDRVRLELPEPNTIVQLEVLARDTSDKTQPWRSVTRGVVYRLRQGGSEIVSPDLMVNATSERHWMIRVDQRGGGLGSGMPVLHVGWVPHQLVFAARGTPPFTLAYGSRTAQPTAMPIASLIPGYREDSTAKIAAAKTAEPVVNVQAVSAQPQKALGGEARLQEQVDWKRRSLWGVLGAGVLVLGVMAWRLKRQMGGDKGH